MCLLEMKQKSLRRSLNVLVAYSMEEDGVLQPHLENKAVLQKRC